MGERGGTELVKDCKPGLKLGSPQSATALYVAAAHEAISAKKKEDIWKNASTNQTALLTTDFYCMGKTHRHFLNDLLLCSTEESHKNNF